MEEKVWVSVSGAEMEDGAEGEKISRLVRGRLREVNGRHHVLYETGEEGSPERRYCHLVLAEDHAEVRESGEAEVRMRFLRGESAGGFYKTGYGTLEVETVTDTYSYQETESEIRAGISYRLRTGGEDAASRRLEIVVSRKPGDFTKSLTEE